MNEPDGGCDKVLYCQPEHPTNYSVPANELGDVILC
jgi:hypothetical protein